MRTSTQYPQTQRKINSGICFKKVKRNTISFSEVYHNSQIKVVFVPQLLRFDRHFFAALFAAFPSFLGIPIVGFFVDGTTWCVTGAGEAICAFENTQRKT